MNDSFSLGEASLMLSNRQQDSDVESGLSENGQTSKQKHNSYELHVRLTPAIDLPLRYDAKLERGIDKCLERLNKLNGGR